MIVKQKTRKHKFVYKIVEPQYDEVVVYDEQEVVRDGKTMIRMI